MCVLLRRGCPKYGSFIRRLRYSDGKFDGVPFSNNESDMSKYLYRIFTIITLARVRTFSGQNASLLGVEE